MSAVALTTALSACGGGSSTTPPHAADDLEIAVERDAAGAPRVRVTGTTVTSIAVSGTWLAWGSSPLGTAETLDAHTVAAVDLATGARRTMRASKAKGVVTPFAGSAGRFVVREIQFQSDGACQDGGGRGCVTWRLWAFDPVTGARSDIAAGDRARSQEANPTVVAGPGWVAWQETRGDGAHVRVLRDGEPEPVTVHTSRFRSTNVAAAGADLVLDDPDVRGRLLRLPGAKGPAEPLLTAPVTHLPSGGDGFVSWLGGAGDAPTAVFAAPLASPQQTRKVGKDVEVYWQIGGGDRLVFGGVTGLFLVSSVFGKAPPRLLTSNADHGVGYAFGDDGRFYYAERGEPGAEETVVVTA